VLLKRGTGPHSWDWPAGFLDSVLWNAMVVPLLRTVHSGVVWYQGTARASESCPSACLPACLKSLHLVS
jgi:hypothetical protein